MLFLKSCSASAVCLVSTFLVVYISHCGSVPVIDDKYLSTGLLPMLNKIIKNPLSETVGLEGLFKTNCSLNEIDPEKDLSSCINTGIDFTALVGRVVKSPVEDLKGELSSVFEEFCQKRIKLHECFQSTYQESSHCWMDGLKRNWLKINDLTNSLSSFACSAKSDAIVQYLADGGSQCLLDKEEDIKICVNKTISAHIPTYLYATPERQLDEEDCSDLKTLQQCALKHLEHCETQSAAIFINNTFNTILSSNCSSAPASVLKRAEIQGDLEESGFWNFASSAISIGYVAVESILKSAVVMVTSSDNTGKDASSKLDGNDGLEPSDSTPSESTRQDDKEIEEDRFSLSQSGEENSTHVDDISGQVEDGEPTEEHPEDLSPSVTDTGSRNGDFIHSDKIEEIEKVPSFELGTNATNLDPTNASKTDIIENNKQSSFDANNGVGTNTTSGSTSEPPGDHAEILNHTTLLVISSYVVLILVIIVLIITSFCENLLPKAD